MIEHTHPGIELRLDRIEQRLTSLEDKFTQMSVEIGLIIEQLNTLTRTTAEILGMLRDRGPN